MTPQRQGSTGIPEPSNASTAPTMPTTTAAIPPRVTTVAPATFVPLDGDITAPFEVPRGRIDRAQAMLHSVDFHRTGVRRSMLHLAMMDKKRILAHSALAAETGNVDVNQGVSPKEIDAMVHNMRRPFLPGTDYSTSNAELAQHMPKFTARLDRPDRRDTVRQQQEVVEQAIAKMRGYERHIRGVQARWTMALDKEKKLLEEQPVSTANTDTGLPQNTSPEDVTMTGHDGTDCR